MDAPTEGNGSPPRELELESEPTSGTGRGLDLADLDELGLEAPKSVGEIFSTAVQALRRHLRSALILMLPFVALELILREAAGTWMASTRDATEALEQGGVQGAEVFELLLSDILVPLTGAMGLMIVVWVVVISMISAATLHAAIALRGKAGSPELSAGPLLRRSLRFVPRLVVTEVLWGFVMTALVMLFASAAAFAIVVFGTGVVGGIVVVVVALFWVAASLAVHLPVALFPQLIILEDLGPIASIVRSAEMMGPKGVKLLAGPKLRFSIVSLVYIAVTSVVQSTFLLPLIFVGLATGIPLEEMPPPLAHVPLWTAVPVAIVQVLAHSVLYPLKAYLPTVFYYDLKVRYGALDEMGPASEPESSAA